jgi:hypothetical protein
VNLVSQRALKDEVLPIRGSKSPWLTAKEAVMALETLLFGSKDTRTSYSPRQLRDKLASMRAGLASQLSKGQLLFVIGGSRVSKEQILAAIDEELAAFAAFDRLLIHVAVQRKALLARLPLLATVIRDLSLALATFVGPNPALRKALGIAPGKKPRRLKPAERLEATAKLNATRKRNRTDAESRKKRRS